ncbi:MAG TPA: glycosyltransferase family 2 protein [Anaerolineae bacterium]|nr:glycosyltransferase family 2 protein [Anaerolineae bacterium]
MSIPFFTVITPTFNRAELADKYLASICAQDFDPSFYRVIIVNNNSTDHTAEIIAKYERQYPFLQGIFEAKQGTSNAKNAAVGMTDSPYLVFFDDDVIVPSKHLSNAYKIIQEYAPDIVAGPVYPYYTVKKPFWFKDKSEIKKFEAHSGFSETQRITGANWIIKRDLFLSLGAFDPEYGPVGDRLGIRAHGDERKILDTYRLRVPKPNQKLYYALECPVQHFVAPQKLSLRFTLYRSYFAGRTQVSLSYEVHGKRFKGRDVRRMLWQAPIRFFRTARNEIRQNGWRNADYVEGLRMASFQVGMFVEGNYRLGMSKHQEQKRNPLAEGLEKKTG